MKFGGAYPGLIAGRGRSVPPRHPHPTTTATTLLSLPCDLGMPVAIDFPQSASQEVIQQNDISRVSVLIMSCRANSAQVCWKIGKMGNSIQSCVCVCVELFFSSSVILEEQRERQSALTKDCRDRSWRDYFLPFGFEEDQREIRKPRVWK